MADKLTSLPPGVIREMGLPFLDLHELVRLSRTHSSFRDEAVAALVARAPILYYKPLNPEVFAALPIHPRPGLRDWYASRMQTAILRYDSACDQINYFIIFNRF